MLTTTFLVLLALIVAVMALILVELLIEEHEDRIARRPWHGRNEEQDTVVIGVAR